MAIENEMQETKRKRHRKGEPTVWEERRGGKQRAYLDALAKGTSINGACRAAKISTGAQLNWRKNDPVFAAEFKAAYAAGTDALEMEARNRALHGVDRKLWYQGRPVIDPDTGKQITERVYSDTLLMFLLKSRHPEQYCDKVRAAKIARRWNERDAAALAKAGLAAPGTAIADIAALLNQLAAEKAALAR